MAEQREARLTIDATSATRTLSQVDSEAERLIQRLDNIPLNLSLDVPTAELAAAEARIEGLDREVNVSFDPDLSPLEQANRLLDELDREIRASIDADDSDVLAAIGTVDRLASELAQLSGTANVDVQLDDSGISAVEGRLDDIDNEVLKPKVEPDTDGVRGLEDALSDAGKRGAQAAAAAFATALVSGVRSSFNREDASALINVGFGLDEESAEFAGSVAGGAFADGYGESIEDAFRTSGSIARALNEFDESLTQNLDSAVRTAENLERTFDVGVSESVRSASQLVRNDLAGSFAEAQQVILDAYTTYDDRAEDFLDTLNEYSSDLEAIGQDADTFFQRVGAGLDEGSFNTDKVGDLFRELRIRISDDSDEIQEAFERLSIPDSITDDIARGGEDAAAGVDLILTKFAELEPGQGRDAILKAIFGSQGEDLTADVVAALADIDDGLDRTTVSLEDFNAELETSGRGFSGFVRGLQGDAGSAFDDVRALVTGNFGEAFGNGIDDIIETVENQRLAELADVVASQLDVALSGVSGSIIDQLREIAGTDITPTVDQAALSAISPGFGRLADNIENVDNKALALIDSLSGPLRDAVEGFLQSPAFTDADAATLSIILDDENLKDQLDEAEVTIDEFLETVDTVANERARLLSERFAESLSGELDRIASQLALDLNIDTENGINDVRDLINETESVLQSFNDRQAAAEKVDLLGFDDLAARIKAGELDELIDDVLSGEGGTNDAILAEAEASLEAVAELRAQESVEVARKARETFENELIEGEQLSLTELLLNSANLDEDDFLAIAKVLVDGLGGAITDSEELGGVADSLLDGFVTDEVLAEARVRGAELTEGITDGVIEHFSVSGEADVQQALLDLEFNSSAGLQARFLEGSTAADNYVDGFVAELRSGQSDVVSAAEDLARAVTTTINSELGIQSPSRVAMQQARHVVEGFAIGLRDDAAVREAAANMTDGLRDLLGGVGGSVGAGSGGGFVDQSRTTIQMAPIAGQSAGARHLANAELVSQLEAARRERMRHYAPAQY